MRCLFKSGTRFRGGGKKQKTISKQRNPNGSLGSPQLGSLGLPIFFCCFIPFFLTPPLQSLVPGHAYLRKASIWKLRATKICFFQVSNITAFFFTETSFDFECIKAKALIPFFWHKNVVLIRGRHLIRGRAYSSEYGTVNILLLVSTCSTATTVV